MGDRIRLSGVPETMPQTVYARAKESRGRGAIHDAKAEEIIHLGREERRSSCGTAAGLPACRRT